MQLKTTFSLVLALALSCGAGGVFAQQTTKAGKAMTPQQERMVACNKEATGKTGEVRKAFMSSCLKGQTAASSHKMTQQEKMTSCNADAKTKSLKGADRKAFMSSCLKGDAMAAPAH